MSIRAIAFRTIGVGGLLAFGPLACGASMADGRGERDDDNRNEAAILNDRLAGVLKQVGFTGNVETFYNKKLKDVLGRPIDQKLVHLGRMLWFDNAHSLHQDNTCGGCHSPSNGFGDSQPMAIGIQNNGIVGPYRSGPRNQRRTPLVINAVLYPAMMWNGRFSSLSGDPFNNRQGFRFPFPEGDTRFSYANNTQHHIDVLAQAQAQMPPTELTEVAGFTGTCPNGVPDRILGSAFCQFDDGMGLSLPAADGTDTRNQPIRIKAASILNSIPKYRKLFGEVFPEVASGAQIDEDMFGKAIAEFEFTLVFANAPIDRFARGDSDAMTSTQKRGALLFFGKGGCVACHAVAGKSSVGTVNEMFSDFEEHVVAPPQIAPGFGVGLGNVIFDGDGANEDFGLEQVTHDPADRYKFRTAPLRNLAVSPAYFHNGSFARLEDAIAHHLNVRKSLRTYDATSAGVPPDLAYIQGPTTPTLDRIDPLLATPNIFSSQELKDLVTFVRDGLLDPRAKPENLCRLIPSEVPSGMLVATFQTCTKK